MYFTYQEAKDLLEFFGGDEETEIAVVEVKERDPNHSGPGLYAYYSEYPDEGSILLGVGRQSDNQSLKTDAQNNGKHNRRRMMIEAKNEASELMPLLCVETGYPAHSWHYCIDAYEDPDGEWDKCPCCGLKPKTWVFDNGRSTACGCWESKYDHFSINAESIMSVHKRTDGKKMLEYDSEELRKNWNHWCKTGEVLFEHASKRNDGRW